MIKLLTTTAMIAAFGLIQMTSAQTASDMENAAYIGVTLVKFKPGKVGAARAHIEKYFAPASVEAGLTRPVTLHMQSGPWDDVRFDRQENGFASFGSDANPDGGIFMATLAKLNGGEENARRIWDEYQAMIATSVREIGHRHITVEEN